MSELFVALKQNEVLLCIILRSCYNFRSISDQVMIVGLFQADCEARGAILWEPTSKAEVDTVNALLNVGK